jgi:hypothetical protein
MTTDVFSFGQTGRVARNHRDQMRDHVMLFLKANGDTSASIVRIQRLNARHGTNSMIPTIRRRDLDHTNGRITRIVIVCRSVDRLVKLAGLDVKDNAGFNVFVGSQLGDMYRVQGTWFQVVKDKSTAKATTTKPSRNTQSTRYLRSIGFL